MGLSPSMKLENFSNLFFVVSVLVPGFIYAGVIGSLIPLRRAKEKEVLLLQYLTATAFNYALCSPLIYPLAFGLIFTTSPIGQIVCWFFIIFLAPVMLALAHARIVQNDSFVWIYRMLKVRQISPIPTGWDWVFSTTGPCFMLITLADGTEIAGYFGPKSMASSESDRRDVYIEKVYRVPVDGGPWQPVADSLGMFVDGAKIAHIEFKEAG